jgi:tetratricopeptide (TPR) repeat protein
MRPIPAGALAGALWLQGCGAQPTPPAAAPMHIDAQPRIITADDVTTEAELIAKGERALMEQNWQLAVDAYSTLLAADATRPQVPEWMFDLGLAYEGLQERGKARDAFLDLARKFANNGKTRPALVRAATLDAYLEDWAALEDIGQVLLARSDIDDVDRLVGLGARGLAKVEAGDDVHAAKDILDGLELADQLHYGDRDVLPVAVAQLRFALAEMWRIRSERIHFDPLPPDFIAKLEERCGGLLTAQAAYAQAVRSVDPHWAAMSGYRVGEMYRELHKELVAIPAPTRSKTEKQKQIFFAFMHLRYRILLEKGLREINQTIALGERTSDSSPWIARAKDAQVDMQTALDDEKAQIQRMPFTEDEVKKALELLEKKVVQKQAAAGARP